MPPDVLAALKDTEYEAFLPRLEAELKSMVTAYNTCLSLLRAPLLTWLIRRIQRRPVRQA